jgi:hypothetical protein
VPCVILIAPITLTMVVLTYMSIQVLIASLEAAGKLTRYEPRSRHPPKRRLYLTDAALKDLNDPSSAVNALVGRGHIEAALTRWTLGDRVYGDAKKCRFLCRLKPPPPEVWDIRVTEPIVQGRLFGRFAEPDTLILTKFHTRSMLGKMGSPNWISAMNSCQATWAGLFGNLPPYSGTTIHDYVTENCDDFPI